MTRTAVAKYLTGHLERERPAALRRTAAWLVATRQPRRARELTREVSRLAAEAGYLYATAATAHPLDAPTRRRAERFLAGHYRARAVELTCTEDPAVLGGIIIDTPTQRLDASLAGRLKHLVQEAAHE